MRHPDYVLATHAAVAAAVDLVYKELKKVSFTNSFYRKDIALRAIENE